MIPFENERNPNEAKEKLIEQTQDDLNGELNDYVNAPMEAQATPELKLNGSIKDDTPRQMSKSQRKKHNKSQKEARVEQLKTDILQLVFYTNNEMEKANTVMHEATQELSTITKNDINEFRA